VLIRLTAYSWGCCARTQGGTFTLANVSAGSVLINVQAADWGKPSHRLLSSLRILQVTQETIVSTFVVMPPSGVAETANLTFAESYQTTYQDWASTTAGTIDFYKLLSN